MVSVIASIFIARHERAEAAEAYADRLTPEQRQYLLDNEADFFFEQRSDKTWCLYIMEDEG